MLPLTRILRRFPSLARISIRLFHPVKQAVWELIEGDGTEEDPDMLCLGMRFAQGNHLRLLRLAAPDQIQFVIYSLEF